jgi:hypothetical protein
MQKFFDHVASRPASGNGVVRSTRPVGSRQRHDGPPTGDHGIVNLR